MPNFLRKKGSTVIFYGWIIISLSFITSLMGSGVRSASGILINPLEAEFGWSRAVVSSAAGVTLLLFGMAAPFWGRLIDIKGARFVMLVSLILLAGGVAATAMVKSLWQFFLFWGLVVGLCSGIGPVLGAFVANRWFKEQRGLALGVLNSAASTGQIIFMPLLMAIIVASNWRAGLMTMVFILLANFLLVLVWMRDDPANVGLKPYGAKEEDQAGLNSAAGKGIKQAGRPPVSILQAIRVPTFWFLAGSYFVCGGTSLGLVGTHLIPYSIDQGISSVTAASLMGFMGALSLGGTLLSGWLTDRVEARRIITVVFFLRGISLFILPFVNSFTGMVVFGIFYGLNWMATVPPVVTITSDTFGKESIGSIYGFIFLSHQIGAFVAASGSGFIRQWLGNYHPAFLIGGVLALAGACLALGIPKQASARLPGKSLEARS